MALLVTDSPEGELEPRAVLGVGVVLYCVLAVTALLWLWARDRLEALPLAAIGRHGPWLAAAVGLAVGWLGALVVAFMTTHMQKLREHETMTRRVFGCMGEVSAVAFVLVAAVAEELFFRLAVQDSFGLAGSVAVYVVLNISIGGLWWLPITLLHALALGLIVQQGFGLLGSATANAILNHLSLRRMQCT